MERGDRLCARMRDVNTFDLDVKLVVFYAPYCPDLVAGKMAVFCIIRIVLYFVLYLYYVLSYPD